MPRVCLILFLVLIISLNAIDLCEASEENKTLDFQRETIYTVNIDKSVEYESTTFIVNIQNEPIYDDGFFIEEAIVLPSNTELELSAWDSRIGVYNFANNYNSKNEALEHMMEGEAGVFNFTDIGTGIQSAELIAHVGEIDFNPTEAMMFKVHFQSNNYINNLDSGVVPLEGDIYENFKNYSYLNTVAAPANISDSLFDVTKDELFVNLPYDAYHYTDSIFAYPPYDDIQYDESRTTLKWDLRKLESSPNKRAIRLIYKVQENNLKKDVDFATLNSHELAKKADAISKISLFISLISLFIAYPPKNSILDIKKWMNKQINENFMKFKK